MTSDLVKSWRFKYKDLSGYISGGHEHGVELTAGVDGVPVTRAMCLNLEHYYAMSRSVGFFVPRYKAAVKSQCLGSRAVRIVIEPFEEWQIRSALTFILLPDRIIEVCYEFSFDADYNGFQALISNYFHRSTEPYLHLSGQWVQPKLSDREHRFWVSGAVEAANIARLYDISGFSSKEAREIEHYIDSQYYDYPVMVTPIAGSSWAVVNIVQPTMCASLSANRRWKAHDFSLVGRDVARGETVECRAWLAYVRLESLDEALSLYDRLVSRDR